MSERFLHRDDAPFGDKVWEVIDNSVVGAAGGQFSGRKILHIEGPYGLGLKSVPGPDRPSEEKPSAGEVTLAACETMPVVLMRADFRLAARDIAAFEATGLALDTGAAAAAAISCARQEDGLIFNGSKALGTRGLLNAGGVGTTKLSSWDAPGAAADDIIKAATNLDAAGFHGPYSLALAAPLFNLLFRRYPQSSGTELEHLQTIVTEGVVKAAAIESGGVLLASGRQFAAIVVGQDLTAGYVGPSGGDYQFTVSESLALRLLRPEAVCVLQGK